MANKYPLILTNAGEFSQQKNTDVLINPRTDQPFDGLISCKAQQTFAKGEVGYVFDSTDPNVDKAIASGGIQLDAFPLCYAVEAITAGQFGLFQFGKGFMDGLSGLANMTPQYLSATTAGAITATAPSTASQYMVKLGHSFKSTQMLWNIQEPLLLS